MALRVLVLAAASIASSWASTPKDDIALVDAKRAGQRRLIAAEIAAGYSVTPLWPDRATDDDASASTDAMIQLYGSSLTMSGTANFFSVSQPGWTSILAGTRQAGSTNILTSSSLIKPTNRTDTLLPSDAALFDTPSMFGWSQAVSSDGDLLLVGAPLYGLPSIMSMMGPPPKASGARAAVTLPGGLPTGTGAAYLFKGCASAAGCKLVSRILSPAPMNISLFGFAVAMPKNGLALFISDPLANGLGGAVYRYACTSPGVCSSTPTVIFGPEQTLDQFASCGKVGGARSARSARGLRLGPESGPLGAVLAIAAPATTAISVFGYSLQAMDSGASVHVGAPNFGFCDDYGGSIHVYHSRTRTSALTWHQTIQAPGSFIGDMFGYSLAASRVAGGTLLVASAPYFSLLDELFYGVIPNFVHGPSIFVYFCRTTGTVRNPTYQQCVLTASLAPDSSSYSGFEFALGLAVAVSDIDASTIAITGNNYEYNINDDPNFVDHGRAWSTIHVFKKNPGSWTYNETFTDYAYGIIDTLGDPMGDNSRLFHAFSRSITVDRTGSTIMSGQTAMLVEGSVVTVWAK